MVKRLRSSVGDAGIEQQSVERVFYLELGDHRPVDARTKGTACRAVRAEANAAAWCQCDPRDETVGAEDRSGRGEGWVVE